MKHRNRLNSVTALFGALVLAACGMVRSTQVPAPESQKASTDSVVEYLITVAATDFQTHVRSDSIRFRDVRLGHVMTSSGAEQYMLCGEFLLAQQEGKAEWTPFATIKTSGYEQWNGAQAKDFCQRPAVTWDKQGDLSSLLQSRFDSQSRQQTADQVSLGMNYDLALKIIGEYGGQDITANLAIVGPRGEKPEPGLFWTLEQYNSVLEIAAEDGKLVGIGYWTLASFSKS